MPDDRPTQATGSTENRLMLLAPMETPCPSAFQHCIHEGPDRQLMPKLDRLVLLHDSTEFGAEPAPALIAMSHRSVTDVPGRLQLGRASR
jgi:hypothetical protein